MQLAASRLKPSRDQRQTINRFNRWVLGSDYAKELNKHYPKSKEEKKTAKSSFDLVSAVHEAEFSSLKPDIHPAHKLEVTLEPDTLTEEKYAVFADYQRHVHRESESSISRAGFRRFLCSSPLHRHTNTNGKLLGSFHQVYRIDGRIVAFSVLDLLPHAISGVYFVYLHEYEQWSFGKLSALRESTLALEAEYEYYYMGYYIDSCKKMRYKNDYKPQFVLDYHGLQWDELNDEMRMLMRTRKYASMSKERERKTVSPASASAEPEAENPEDSKTDDDEAVHVQPLDSIFKHATPKAAMESNLSLFQLGMPGLLSRQEVDEQFDLDQIKVSLGRGQVYGASRLMGWDEDDGSMSLKGLFAEMVAGISPEVAQDIVVDFGR